MPLKFLKSKFTLYFKDEVNEITFNNSVNKNNLWKAKRITFLLFVMCIIDFVLEFSFKNEAETLNLPYFPMSYQFSKAMLIISPILFIMSLIRNLTVVKISSWLTYLFLTIPFTNVMKIIPDMKIADQNINTFLNFVSILLRGYMLIHFLIPYPKTTYLLLIQIFTTFAYFCLLKMYLAILFSLTSICIQFVFSYLITLTYKKMIYSNYKLQMSNRWYNNLIEHFNSGFISFNRNEINMINNFLKELLINKGLIKNKNELQNLISESPEKIFNNLFQNIHSEYDHETSEIFDYAKFYETCKENYLKEDNQEKFIFLGYKNFDFYENTNNNSNKTIRKFEVYYRYHKNTNNDEQEDEIEFVYTDISKIKQLEEKSAELKYKSIFLSKVAHEFKNPIIGISELAYEIQEQSESKKNMENTNLRYNSDSVTIMNNNSSSIDIENKFKMLRSICDYLLILIKDLDYFSCLQIKQEPHSLENTNVNLQNLLDFIKKIGECLIYKNNKRNLSIITENNSESEYIFSDEIKLKQILINLVSNAIKFTNEGLIKVEIRKEKDTLEFEVKDTGIGIPQEQIENIATPFNKSNKDYENRYGSGLGLYIVTQMLTQLKSKLNIQSEVNKGSLFTFMIDNTMAFVGSKSRRFSVFDNNSIVTKQIEFSNNLEHFFVLNTEEVILNVNDVSIKNEMIEKEKAVLNILVIDDEKFVRSCTIRIIKKEANKRNINLNIYEAEDGIESLYLIYNLSRQGVIINCIVSDEMMNYMNGTQFYDVLRLIKNINTFNTNFYLLTAYVDVNSRNFKKVIQKPLGEFDAEKIIEENIDDI